MFLFWYIIFSEKTSTPVFDEVLLQNGKRRNHIPPSKTKTNVFVTETKYRLRKEEDTRLPDDGVAENFCTLLTQIAGKAYRTCHRLPAGEEIEVTGKEGFEQATIFVNYLPIAGDDAVPVAESNSGKKLRRSTGADGGVVLPCEKTADQIRVLRGNPSQPETREAETL